MSEAVTLRPWADADRPLLTAANSAMMTAHLGGPETEQKLDERHERYRRLVATGEARMFVIEDPAGTALGSIGYWSTAWRDQQALEAGWFVVPEAQGRGIAGRALTVLIEDARAHRGDRRALVALPSVHNAASNGVCRRNGFELVGTLTEKFRGAELTLNEWVLDLTAP